MPIVNIIDGRKRPYRFAKINAVVEAAWHDNSVKDADRAPHEIDGPSYEELEHRSLEHALLWAGGFAGPVTIYLYDEDGGIYETEKQAANAELTQETK